MKNSILMKSGIPLIIVLVAFIAATVMIKSRKPPEQVPVEIPAFLVEAKEATAEAVSFIVNLRVTLFHEIKLR